MNTDAPQPSAGSARPYPASPPVIDFGDEPLTVNEQALLREFYVDGLGEYAYRNELERIS